MIKGLLTKNGSGLFQWLVSVSTIIALILQCLDIDEPWVPIIAYIVIIFAIISAITGFVSWKKTVLRRKKLIKLTKKHMYNAQSNVIMFGGDLSWANEYLETINHLTNNNKVVEIFFPYEKISSSKTSALNEFDKRVEALTQNGAIVYWSNEDFKLRCTLIDAELQNENRDFCVISSKRIYTNESNQNKNKYRVNILHNSIDVDKDLCNSFFRNYILIKKSSCKY